MLTMAPVFYSDKARNKWGRKQKPGKVMIRDILSDSTMHNSRRKLLTSIGHPDVFIKQNTGPSHVNAMYSR